MSGKGLALEKIRKLPEIASWKSAKRHCFYYKGEGELVYLVYSDSVADSCKKYYVCYITLFPTDGGFTFLFQRRGSSNPQIGSTSCHKEKAVTLLIERIFDETGVYRQCKMEEIARLQTALKENLLPKSEELG